MENACKNIVPAKRIGRIHIGMELEAVRQLCPLDTRCILWGPEGNIKLVSENIVIWIDGITKMVDQIMATDNYDGYVEGCNNLRIGVPLQVAVDAGYDIYENLTDDTYGLHGLDGVFFELEDIIEGQEEFNPLVLPIKHIIVC